MERGGFWSVAGHKLGVSCTGFNFLKFSRWCVPNAAALVLQDFVAEVALPCVHVEGGSGSRNKKTLLKSRRYSAVRYP